MRFFCILISMIFYSSLSVIAGGGIYLRGSFNGWDTKEDYEFSTSDNNIYILSNVTLTSSDEWKIADCNWSTVDFGGVTDLASGVLTELEYKGRNCRVSDPYQGTMVYIASIHSVFLGEADQIPPLPEVAVEGLSGTLPVIYINIFKTDAEGNLTSELDNKVIDINLDDKDYRPGVYWLDVSACEDAEEYGFENIGSKQEPLPLEMKARGNYTRWAFAKKPFKLKLGKKQDMLGMTPDKSKHWALMAHADDTYGYMRNFVGFNLGARIGLPWTPKQQPVEVVINGDYRGLYFLTESIRVGDGRVPIAELDDNCTDPALISGGYLVELDNYDEDNQIRLTEGSCVSGHKPDVLRITFNTPEEYSDIQRRFITDQISAINGYVSIANTTDGNQLWSYLDLDDAVRYYMVKEIISDVESFHGSTYLYRDRGEGQKWHFSPLWDCGNAFNGSSQSFFFDCDPFGNTWIPSMAINDKFVAKVKDTWLWFMSSCYEGIVDDIDEYVSRISAAAVADRKRWKDSPTPSQPVADNSDMKSKRNDVVGKLNRKTAWLKGKWGDYTGATFTEPERDNTPAASLPSYLSLWNTAIDSSVGADVEYFDLQGRRLSAPLQKGITIVRSATSVTKILR